eukprot:357490-Chlamydomonas_euryale.AAC.1
MAMPFPLRHVWGFTYTDAHGLDDHALPVAARVELHTCAARTSMDTPGDMSSASLLVAAAAYVAASSCRA